MLDYINKSPKTKVIRKATIFRAFIFVSMCFIVMSLVVFTYFAEEVNNASNLLQISKNITNPQGFVTPQIPQDKYSYPEILMTTELDETLPQYYVPQEQKHRLKCGSFLLKEKALRLSNEASAVVNLNVTKLGRWFVVRSNWLKNKRTAQRLANTLKKKAGIYQCLVEAQ